MNCREFRRSILAEPHAADAERDRHQAGCPDCARLAGEVHALEARLHAALVVPVPLGVVRPVRPARRAWLALAAGLGAAAVLVATLGVLGPRATLAGDVAAHAGHEPQSWLAQAPADADAVRYVLARAQVALLPGVGAVSYAHSCWFRGHFVPHLVVRDGDRLVMVLVLRAETVAAPIRVDEAGYHGLIVPAARGSLAVLARGRSDVAAVSAVVAARLRYLD